MRTQRYVSKGGRLRERFSDPDASWGHRSSISTRSGGGFYGYKVHAAVCTETGLPLAWEVHTAKDAEVPVVPRLLDALTARGFSPAYAMLDKGYDANRIYETCEARGMAVLVDRPTDGAPPARDLHVGHRVTRHAVVAPGSTQRRSRAAIARVLSDGLLTTPVALVTATIALWASLRILG
jgi:Transposase DDE domain